MAQKRAKEQERRKLKPEEYFVRTGNWIRAWRWFYQLQDSSKGTSIILLILLFIHRLYGNDVSYMIFNKVIL